MLQQLNAERARRAQVMEAKGKSGGRIGGGRRSLRRRAGGKAQADHRGCEAYATGVIATAIAGGGLRRRSIRWR